MSLEINNLRLEMQPSGDNELIFQLPYCQLSMHTYELSRTIQPFFLFVNY